ncbi:MAG: hypothetical protein H6695_12020 [Deferribacteres bacterium]|nr:hypothetical protein [candidate division KSB1 bacterium]MCB9510907.1 hypothetical protein [Deferribacteres bacterium]
MQKKIKLAAFILLLPTLALPQSSPRSKALSHPGYLATLEKSWPQEQIGINIRSVPRSMLMSAMVPGLGQVGNKSYLKAGFFIALEAVSWYIALDQHSKGNDLETKFEAFADLYWNEDRYWDALSEESGISRSQMDSLRAWERGHFSHHLPEEKNQTYYENVGKYNQFNIGWQDANTHREFDSELRRDYTFQRKDANDAFELSRTFTTVIILNHIASALEAAYSTHKQNQRFSTAMRFKPMKYNGDYIPAMALRISW